MNDSSRQVSCYVTSAVVHIVSDARTDKLNAIRTVKLYRQREIVLTVDSFCGIRSEVQM